MGVCVYIYVYICVCVCVCMYTHVCVYMYISTYIYILWKSDISEEIKRDFFQALAGLVLLYGCII